jgi:ABC-type multidrug transport system fused ATPase/permease subunit
MIRRLYKEYRLQIAFAFILVIFENLAYVAEPYVFGKAIDGLREAHQVEEEVDSSITTIQMHQMADSIRAHILDSIKIVDSLRQIDSLTSMVDDGTMKDEGNSIAGNSSPPSSLRQAQGRLFIPHHSSFIYPALYIVGSKHNARETDSETFQIPFPGTPQRAQYDSVRRKLARHDSIRSRQRHSKQPKMTRDAARDTILKAHAARKLPGPGKPAGVLPQPKSAKPLSFYFTQEITPFLPPLIPWVLLFLINSGLGAFRRIYDTRTYTKMFANLASDVVARQLAQGEELSKVAARSAMAWHNIEFFHYNVPEFLEQLIAVGGAVIALALFDWRLTVVGSVLIVFVAIGSKYYMRALQTIQSKLHDRYEDEFNIFGTREPAKIRSYYSGIADLEIKYSVRSTTSYGVIRVFLLIMFLSTLYISIDLDRFTIGALYSIVAYVWSFVTATEYIPYLSEKWVELRDASRRITEALPTDA